MYPWLCQVIQKKREYSVLVAYNYGRMTARKAWVTKVIGFVAFRRRKSSFRTGFSGVRRDTWTRLARADAFHFTSIPFSHWNAAFRVRGWGRKDVMCEWRTRRKRDARERTRALVPTRLTDSPPWVSWVVGRIASRDEDFGCCVSSGKNSHATAKDEGARYRPRRNQRSRADRSRRTRPAVILALPLSLRSHVDALMYIVTSKIQILVYIYFFAMK